MLFPRRRIRHLQSRHARPRCAGASPTRQAAWWCRWTTAWRLNTGSRRRPRTRMARLATSPSTPAEFGDRSGADRGGRRQRRREPGDRRRDHGARSRRSGAEIPVADLSRDRFTPTASPSMREYGDGSFPRSTQLMDWFADQYVARAPGSARAVRRRRRIRQRPDRSSRGHGHHRRMRPAARSGRSVCARSSRAPECPSCSSATTG